MAGLTMMREHLRPLGINRILQTWPILFSISIAAAQGIAIGVKGGLPFADVFEARGFIGAEPFRASTQRFTVGPMLDVRLPLGFGVEFDALYKRFDQSGGSIHGGTVSRTGSSWEFPMLGKFRYGGSRMKPYIEAGVSFDHLSGYLVTFRTLPTPPSDQPEISTTRTGFAVGAGIELKLPIVRISPGFRFSRWGDRFPVPGTSAVDFLVGIAF